MCVRYSNHKLDRSFVVRKLKVKCFGILIEATDIEPRLVLICLLGLVVWGAKRWLIGM